MLTEEYTNFREKILIVKNSNIYKVNYFRCLKLTGLAKKCPYTRLWQYVSAL